MRTHAKLLALALIAVLILSAVACAAPAEAPAAPADPAAPAEPATPVEPAAPEADALKVGVSMPTKSLQRWNQDGDNMKKMLEDAGYEVDLQYGGENEIPMQIAQIENMIASDCKVLVIAAIDGDSLTEVLATAKSKDIPVIAYDRLIMGRTP